MTTTRIKISLLALFMPCITTTLTINGMEQPKKTLLLKIKSNPTSTSAFLVDRFMREEIKNHFGLPSTQAEPFVFVVIPTPKQSKADCDRLRSLGYDDAHIQQAALSYSHNKYAPIPLPASCLINKKHGDIILTKTVNGATIHYIYNCTKKTPLTTKVKSDMLQFKNNPCIMVFHPGGLSQEEQQSFFKKDILTNHNGHVGHGSLSYFAEAPHNNAQEKLAIQSPATVIVMQKDCKNK